MSLGIREPGKSDPAAKCDALFSLTRIGVMEAIPGWSRLARVNDKFCVVTGYSREELLDRSVIDLIHPDDPPIPVGLTGCEGDNRGISRRKDSYERMAR